MAKVIYNIKSTDTWLIDNNMDETEFVLPTPPYAPLYTGIIYYIQWVQPKGFTINGNGRKILSQSKLVDIAQSRGGQGALNIIAFDGEVWHLNYCPA